MTCCVSTDLILRVINGETIVEPYNDDVIDAINRCFREFCLTNLLDDAKDMWKKWTKYIEIYRGNDYLWYNVCRNDHLDVAKWLWEICLVEKIPIDINTYIKQALEATRNIEMIEWLLEISSSEDISNLIDNISGITGIFQKLIMHNKLCLAKLLWERRHKSITPNYLSKIFEDACTKSDLETIKWIWGICSRECICLFRGTNYNGSTINMDNMFYTCCQRNDIEIIDWFCELSTEYWYEKDATDKVVNWYKK